MTAARSLPAMATLKALLDYNPETGILTWKARPGKNKWNAQNAGNEAFTAIRDGYKCGSINGVLYQAHRVCFAIHNGYDPKERQIDHDDGDRSNNREANLFAVTNQQNAQNRKPYSKTPSGTLGVSWSKLCNKWRAYITANDKQISLGYFDDKEAACQARKAAEIKYGFVGAVRKKNPAVKRPRIKPKGYTTLEEFHVARLRKMKCCVPGCNQFSIAHHIMVVPLGYTKRTRRDHRFAVNLCHTHHNGDNDSVHLLGSEAKFKEVHRFDLFLIALNEWSISTELFERAQT